MRGAVSGRPVMHPRSSVARGQPAKSTRRQLWWKSTTTISLLTAVVASVVTLYATSLTTDSAAQTFYAEQRAEAYMNFLSTSTDVMAATARGAARPEGQSTRRLLSPELADKLQNDWANVQLVGSDRAQDAAERFVYEALTSGPEDNDVVKPLVRLRAVFRDVARADIEPPDGSWWW